MSRSSSLRDRDRQSVLGSIRHRKPRISRTSSGSRPGRMVAVLYGHESSDKVIVEAVASIAAARGVSRAQIALAWLLRNPVISAPIVGARKPAHLDDAIAALDIELTDDEVTQLETGYTPHPVAQGGLNESDLRATAASINMLPRA
jgi:aryl-alcohol dehydrogenase-like predicted oxidoreductase